MKSEGKTYGKNAKQHALLNACVCVCVILQKKKIKHFGTSVFRPR